MGGHRMVPSADAHFYSATKYAVTALTEGLRQELREAKTHIRATVPPHTHTHTFTHRASIGLTPVRCFNNMKQQMASIHHSFNMVWCKTKGKGHFSTNKTIKVI